MHYSTGSMATVSCKKGGLLRHVGILLPNGMVAHCSPKRGEHLSTVEEFADGHDVTIDELIETSQWELLLYRLNRFLAAPSAYHAVTNNCEVFVNRLLARQPTSPQVRGILLVLSLMAIAGFASGQ
jgi:hypothetical protein